MFECQIENEQYISKAGEDQYGRKILILVHYLQNRSTANGFRADEDAFGIL